MTQGETQDTAPAASARLWRWGRRCLWAGAALLLLVVLLIGGARLYLSDSRLTELLRQELNNRLPATVDLEAVELALLGGLTLRNLRVGPPPQFTKDVLRLELLRLRWDAIALLKGNVVVEEVTLRNLYAAAEEHPEQGLNINVLLAPLQGPPAEPPPPSEPFNAGTFQLPLPITVRNLAISGVEGEFLTPAQHVGLNHLGVSGSFQGEGSALHTQLTVHLGDPEQQQAAKVFAYLHEAATRVELAPSLALQVATTGLGDMNVALNLQTAAQVQQGDTQFPPLNISIDLTAAADLLTQAAQVKELALAVGDGTRLSAAATATGWLGEPNDIALALKKLELTSALKELTPLVRVFVPGITLGGDLALHLDPLEATVGALQAPQGLTPRLQLTLTEGAVQLQDLRVEGAQVDLAAHLEEGSAAAQLALGVKRVRAAGQQVEGIDLNLNATSPLTPWLGGAPDPEPVRAKATLAVARGAGEPWRARGVRLNLNASAPSQLLLHGSSAQPARVDLKLAVHGGEAAVATTRNLALAVKASTFDLAGQRAGATVQLSLGRTSVALSAQEDPLRLKELSLHTVAAARGTRYTIETLELKAEELLHLSLSGTVSDPAGPRPEVTGLHAHLHPLRLENVIARLPPSMRPPAQLGGSVGLNLRVDGQIPHAQLARDFTPPPMEFSEDPQAQRKAMATLVSYVDHVAARLERGLPVEANLLLTMQDGTVEHPSVAARGIGLNLDVDLSRAGPQVRSVLSAEHLSHPDTLSGAINETTVSFRNRTLELRTQQRVGHYARAGLLLRPVENASTELAVVYRVGGDLLLEKLAVSVPDRPVELEASGLVIKPVRAFLEDGFRKEGLPGVEAQLRWKARVGSGALEPPVVGAPAVQGELGLAGQLGVRDGIVALTGELDSKDFIMEQETPAADGQSARVLRLEDLDGGLPFDLRVAFKPTPEATLLRYFTLPFAGGAVGLVTARQDIRNRPARPVHFDRLLPYQARPGLTLDRVVWGTRGADGSVQPQFSIDDLSLYARLENGVLAADHIGLQVLGGDIRGELAVQLSRQNELLSKLALKFSNLDASNILDLPPGPDSELSADADIAVRLAPMTRDIEMNTHITKIGSQSLDRILLALRKEEGDSLDQVRGQLGLITLHSVATRMKYENLYLDLDYTTFLPGVSIEDIPRQSMSDRLDSLVQPYLDTYLAPALGWPTRALTAAP